MSHQQWLSQLDEFLQRLRPGGNVVWQIDRLEDYSRFAELFAEQALRCGAACFLQEEAGESK